MKSTAARASAMASSTPMEVDSPLVAVERSIQDVEGQIKAVEDQLKKEQDPDEKKYLRKKEERLWNDKEYLQKKDLLLLKSNVTFSEATAWNIWETSKKFLRPVLLKWPRDIHSYQSVFPSSVAPVCDRGMKKPCLLYHGLQSAMVKVDSRLAERVGRKQQLTVLLAPSGSGKTRNLIEMACSRYCLFFVGSQALLGAAPGSKDVATLARWLDTKVNPVDLMDALSIGVGILLLSRLLILSLLKELGGACCARDWAFFQLEYPAVVDVFANQVSSFLGSIPAAPNYGGIKQVVRALVVQVAASLAWDGIVVLDEAQLLGKQLEGRFSSAELGPGRRSLLNPFVLELLGFGSVAGSLFISGTGRTMFQVSKSLLSSGSLKEFDRKVINRIPGFQSEAEMQMYAAQVVDIQHLDIKAIFKLYRGRRRWFVTALERYMAVTHARGQETEFFLQFSNDVVEKTGLELGLVRSVRDDAKDMLRTVERDMIVRIVVSHYYLGKGYTVYPATEDTMKLIEFGLGYVAEGEELLEQVPVLDITERIDDEEDVKAVMLMEPLVLMALIAVIPKKMLLSCFADIGNSGCEALGLAYEYSGEIAKALDGTILAEKLSCLSVKQELNDVYWHKFELVKGKLPCVVFSKEASPLYALNQWLDAVEEGEHFPPVLLPGKLYPHGPDAMFFLRDMQTKKMMLVVQQYKAKYEVDKWDALGTLVLLDMYIDVPELQVARKRLQEFAKNGYVQVVVTTPFQNFQQQTMKMDVHIHDSTVIGGVAPLVCLLDKNNVCSIVDENVLKIVDSCKKRIGEREKDAKINKRQK